MASVFSNISDPVLPVVELHALSAGHFTLPEEQFIWPVTPGARKTVPSLAFLVQHSDRTSGDITRIVFDLGVRRVIERYSEPIQQHLATRQPLVADPDVVKSLAAGGLTPDDIDFVFYSHVHWDHVGEPRDFTKSTFVVGNGSLDVLAGKSKHMRGSHSFFESDLLDPSRTIELPDPASQNQVKSETNASPTTDSQSPIAINVTGPWEQLDGLPAVLDVFEDGSLYVVDAPGHLPGHINLLARTIRDDGNRAWVYLGGDFCHDRRILNGEKVISEWLDTHGQVCCIHANRAQADETIERARVLEGWEEVMIFVGWTQTASGQSRSPTDEAIYASTPLIFNPGCTVLITSRKKVFKKKTFPYFRLPGIPPIAAPHYIASTWGIRRRELISSRDAYLQYWGFSMEFSNYQRIMTTEEQEHRKDEFDAKLGPDAFHSGWESLLRIDPAFFSASVSLASVPRRKSHLSHKDQALISLAVDCAATHLYAPGIREHVTAATKEGANRDEILEVIELSSTLGIHACNIGVPLLVEVLKEEGKYLDDVVRPFDETQQTLKREFTANRGYWHTFWEDFLRLDPEFFAGYLEFSSLPWVKGADGSVGKGKGALEPKMKELVYCAFDAASTHLYVPGLKLHMKNALSYGATPQEILEVLELATLLSLHTAHVAAPIIEELTRSSS